jgi:hypothetical protein
VGPSWAESGQSEHEGIETSSRCCLSLGRDDMLHPVLHGHCLGRVAERSGDCVTSTTPSTSSLREAHASKKSVYPPSEFCFCGFFKVVRSHTLGEFWKSALHKSMSAKASGTGEGGERMDNGGARQ